MLIYYTCVIVFRVFTIKTQMAAKFLHLRV